MHFHDSDHLHIYPPKCILLKYFKRYNGTRPTNTKRCWSWVFFFTIFFWFSARIMHKKGNGISLLYLKNAVNTMPYRCGLGLPAKTLIYITIRWQDYFYHFHLSQKHFGYNSCRGLAQQLRSETFRGWLLSAKPKEKPAFISKTCFGFKKMYVMYFVDLLWYTGLM